MAEYLSRSQLCNLFLDTNPYNAGIAASDALRVGLPVVTILGNTFSGRMGASSLQSLDMPELLFDT